ncbi:RNA 2',3'-cyclic phosphodiesterase [Sphingosinicella sp. YJ22]|uniref:RNA 2',3'-cyclic phosphodiesterase n=1 Tax=Sphingosinicella sp. YJ22 TaxID=1104780 RepID=UPI00140C79C0|nr:RNA 2',3'-cyclic phosphodiesterase [Sphingosinicella sp. YJ22]
MHRLFVAIRPPSNIRDALLDLMGGISGARWQDDDQLHLTLRFLGEVDRHQAEDVHAALGSIHHPPFGLAVSGLGVFDKRGVPTTAWAGVAPPEPVHTLHKKVDQAMARVGIEPDRRAFHPHITLARLGRSSGRTDGFLARSGTVSSEVFRVGAFGLYESRLTPDGAVYTKLETYPLA